MPAEANPLDPYESFAELRAVCETFCEAASALDHRQTRQPPGEQLVAERRDLHRIPTEAHIVAFGVTRLVDDDANMRFGLARYSVPHTLASERVWFRVSGDYVV